MTLKQSKLNQIPTRNKDLAFGYVNECEKKYRSSIPSMIKYLCLIYSNQNKDEFDPENTHKQLTINENCLAWGGNIPNGGLPCTRTSLLSNVIDKGINLWKFRVNDIRCDGLIGIRRKDKCFNDDIWFDEEEDNDESAGYGLFGCARLTNPENCKIAAMGRRYGQAFEFEDIIEMRLDCIEWTLSYTIDGTDFGKAFDIEPNMYRAAITMTDDYPEGSFSLISSK